MSGVFLGRLNRTFYGIETVPLRPLQGQDAGLNRTFYGIETFDVKDSTNANKSLNRTFYGIETIYKVKQVYCPRVLIVPFMELKHRRQRRRLSSPACLNRTFYGIETRQDINTIGNERVLIVPFMELKHTFRLQMFG